MSENNAADTTQPAVRPSVDGLRNVRHAMRRAAYKTILIVRSKNATQSAEHVAILFSESQVTPLPRAVRLDEFIEKVIGAYPFFRSKRDLRLFQNHFLVFPELQNVMIDIFWFLIATYFHIQQDKCIQEQLHQRIAKNLTLLFMRLQSQSSAQARSFYEYLPDISAQILFLAINCAFPRSRERIDGADFRQHVLNICYSWIIGFIPAHASHLHWVAFDEKCIADERPLAEFPAMRNRMIRAERLERAKEEVRLGYRPSQASTPDQFPSGMTVDSNHDATAKEVKVDNKGQACRIVHERALFQIQNSPLVHAFLKRHEISATSEKLQIRLRMTTKGGANFDSKSCETGVRRKPHVPIERRTITSLPCIINRRIIQQEKTGLENMRKSYWIEKASVFKQNHAEQQQLAVATKELQCRLLRLKQNGEKLHEFSNSVARRIES